MGVKNYTVIIVLTMMLSSGCLAGINDVVDDAIDETYEYIDGEYPMLLLSQRYRGDPGLQNYGKCADLLSDLRNAAYDEMLVSLDQQAYWHWSNGPVWRFTDDVAFADGAVPESTDAPTSGSVDSGDRNREGDFSGTNNQEVGVDEADFLKTDGYNIYMLNGDNLVIMGIPEFGEVTLRSNISLEGNPLQMMLEGDKLVIASMIYTWNLPVSHPLTDLVVESQVNSLVKYTVVDITDKTSPAVNRELYIEGNYHTSRLVDGTVRSVTHIWSNLNGVRNWVQLPENYWSEDGVTKMEIWNRSIVETIEYNNQIISSLTLEDFAPKMYESMESGMFVYPVSSQECSEFSASEGSAGRGFTSIITLDLFGDDVEMEVDHITSSWAHVYSSQNMLVLAEPANDWWWFWRNTDWDDATNIHSFDISEAGSTQYIGSGRVDGTVQDQFSISEFEGSIRIASTSDAWARWWLVDEVDEDGEPVWSGPKNQVSILQPDEEGNLDQIGFIGDIAIGERIWSARFVGDRGYLVTFQNIDPLWVIDLSIPTDPTILGELEVPGVSTYIHPVNENTLLTIGIGPGADGLGLDWSSTQISLFDISDPSNPTLADTLPISPVQPDESCEDVRICGWSWSWSEATFEHKAFNYWAPENLLAVPLSTYRYTYNQNDEYGSYEYVSMLNVLNVDIVNMSLSEHGIIDHSSFYNSDDSDTYWWYSYSTDIRRSIFMGDYLYAFSALGVTIHRTSDLNPIQELHIPGHESPTYHEEEVEIEGDES
tara:strand:+ start:18692 stop:20989 length:2298 start_codon:yes stop_codon:yes gene_type:complete